MAQYKLIDGREVVGVSLSHYRYVAYGNGPSDEVVAHARAHNLEVDDGHLMKPTKKAEVSGNRCRVVHGPGLSDIVRGL